MRSVCFDQVDLICDVLSSKNLLDVSGYLDQVPLGVLQYLRLELVQLLRGHFEFLQE